MRDWIVVAVGPIPDRCQHAVRVEVERVGAAAELGRKQRNPFAQPAPADVGLGIDQFTRDVVALRFRISAAGMLGALLGYRSGCNPGMPNRGRFANDGRTGHDLQQIAAVEFRLRRRLTYARWSNLRLLLQV